VLSMPCGTIPPMTDRPATLIEPAQPRDIPQLAHLLAESLFDDPLQRWMFPDATRRMATSEWMFRRLLKSKIAQRTVRVIRDNNQQVASVAVWTPPHPPAPTRWEHYSESLFMRWVHGKRIHEIRDGFTALAARLPRVRYWYLQVLATSPAQRGQGHAGRLVHEQLTLSTASGELIALQTSNPANLAYYQKLGFEVADELVLQNRFPVWLMCRNADAISTSST
jgi:ribosomal protein S18 acetylase RimI-like enzyme